MKKNKRTILVIGEPHGIGVNIISPIDIGKLLIVDEPSKKVKSLHEYIKTTEFKELEHNSANIKSSRNKRRENKRKNK